MVEGLTEHVLIAAMYATSSASRLWEDDPFPPLAQAAQDAPDTGPSAEDIHRILSTRAPPKTHPQIRPIQLVSWDAMDSASGAVVGAMHCGRCLSTRCW